MAKKNADGLVGQSPLDPEISEVIPGNGPKMQISGPGGAPVRATHPGLVTEVRKSANSFTVRIVALGTLLNNFLGLDTDTLPYSKYEGLGGVEVAPGEKVSVGQQIGTLAFLPTKDGPGGKVGFTYRVFVDGSGSNASERNPRGEAGIKLVTEAQIRGETPPDAALLREAPPEASVGDPGLNSTAGAEETENPATLDNAGNSNFPYRSRPQVKFVEQKNQVFNHDLLVFINGVDVTQYVVDTLNINIVDKDGWNEANFALNNAQNNFVISLENLGFNNDLEGSFRSSNIPGESKYSEFAKREIIKYKQDEKRNPFVNIAQMAIVGAAITQGITDFDTEKAGKQVQAITTQTKPRYVADQAKAAQRDGKSSERLTTPDDGSLTDRRWQLGFQSVVFHKHDPIRIFRKNPIRSTDEWMPAFTGYLDQISYDTNYINGLSTIKISCYDIRALAANMRVQETSVTSLVNPRALFQGTEAGSASLFSDLINPTSTGHPLQAKKFEDVMEFIITGTSTQEKDLRNAFGASKFRRGIGDFTVGERINYNPGDSSKGILPDPLEHWHALCLFGTDGKVFRSGVLNPNDIQAQEDAGTRETISQLEELEALGVLTAAELKDLQDAKDSLAARTPPKGPSTATKQGVWKRGLDRSFDRRFLTEVEARTIGANTTHDGEWAPHKQFVHFLLPGEGTGAKNLLQADVQNVSSNQLDFRSRLDIMQDFAARIDYQFWVSPIGDFIVEFPQYDFFPEDYGEYKTVFQVDKHLRSDVIQDEAGDMTTVIVAHGRIRPENEANTQDSIQPKAVVVSPMMMMRYGVIEHELTLPFISNTESLARIAVIEFQKLLAATNRMDMEFNYRPFILPNRPIEHMERKRMGLTTAVQNNITVFQEGMTNITTRYVRRQIFRKDGVPAYLFISSGTSMPITYREIYEPGTVVPETGGAAGGVVLDTNTAQLGDEALVTPGNKSTTVVTRGIASPGRSPTPPDAQVGVFMALAQKLSGWNPLNRSDEGGFGMFDMPKDLRDSLGIGDSVDIEVQAMAADQYWRDLVCKYNGDPSQEPVYDDAAAEFVLGFEKIKNDGLVKSFKEGAWQGIEKLGKEYEDAKQEVIDGWNRLFPGEEEPVDEQLALQSQKAKEESEASEKVGPSASGRGFRTTQGVLVFKRGVNSNTNTEGAVEKQAKENGVNNGT